MTTLLIASLISFNAPASIFPHPAVRMRPASWARPVSAPGLENAYWLDDRIIRGAQPTEEGIRTLSRLGVHVLISFRTSRGDDDLAPEIAVRRLRIPVNPWLAIRDRDVVDFLRFVTRPENRRVFIHCRYGADRTGVMCAAYRVVVQGWSKEEAIAEMVRGGYGFHGWGHMIAHVRNMDVESIRRQAGFSQPTIIIAAGSKIGPPAPSPDVQPRSISPEKLADSPQTFAVTVPASDRP